MLLAARGRARLWISSRSFVVGDRWHDVGAARAVGARGVLVRTGYGRMRRRTPGRTSTRTAIVDNLIGAVAWILRQS